MISGFLSESIIVATLFIICISFAIRTLFMSNDNYGERNIHSQAPFITRSVCLLHPPCLYLQTPERQVTNKDFMKIIIMILF